MMITDELLIDCCKALHGRALNAGSWVNGEIPLALQEVRKEYGFAENHTNWIIVIEQIVSNMAISGIALGKFKLTTNRMPATICHE